jgi:hypothetical protein
LAASTPSRPTAPFRPRRQSSRAGLRGDGAEPAGAEHVGGGGEAREEIIGRRVGDGPQGAVGERNPHQLGLGVFNSNQVDTRALVAGPADLTGVVGSPKRADHELAVLDRGDLSADLLDDAVALMLMGDGSPGRVRRFLDV